MRTMPRARPAAILSAVAVALIGATMTVSPVPAVAATPEPTRAVDEAGDQVAPQGSEDENRVTFGVQPASGDGELDARAFFQYGLSPGSTVFDSVGIVNYGPTPVTLEVYGTDAFANEEGSFSIPRTTDTPIDVGSWISLGDGVTSVEVPAAGASPGKVVLPVTIEVPQNASPGDHAGSVMAVLRSLGENPESQDVELEQRVASRVYVRVAGELVPGLSITDISTEYESPSLPWQPGRLRVEYVVTNSGNARLGVAPPEATLTAPFDVFERSATGEGLQELLPAGTYVVTHDFEDVWPLFRLRLGLTANAVAAPGLEEVTVPPVIATVAVTVIPWAWLVALGVLVVVIVLLVWLRRRRAKGGGGRGRSRAAGPDGDGGSTDGHVPSRNESVGAGRTD